MSQSNATITPTNIIISPVRLTFNGVDLGGTESGVEINMNPEFADKMVDQFGKTAIDKVISGYKFSVKTVLTEILNMDNWKVAMPTAKEIVNGGNKSMYVDMQVGASLLASAHQLLIHPLSKLDSDLTSDYLFYKAAVGSAVPVKFGPDKQSGLAVEWFIFPDTSVIPAKFLTIGDPANGAVAASAGSATPGGGNTGNGTIDTITVTSGVTKTETITVTCLDATSGNDFIVSGSLSGALGYVHVGAVSTNQATFTPTSGSPTVISFKIHQGSTQFAVGDTFTIATTAANYS